MYGQGKSLWGSDILTQTSHLKVWGSSTQGITSTKQTTWGWERKARVAGMKWIRGKVGEDEVRQTIPMVKNLDFNHNEA